MLEGNWNLAEMKSTTLPDEVKIGFNKLTEGLGGIEYIPILYCGKQVDVGTNYSIICRRKLGGKKGVDNLVEIILNSFQGSWILAEMFIIH